MLKLYAVKVWLAREPRNCETIEVRTHTARRAQDLAIESYPGCDAHTQHMLVEGTWHCAADDD